MTAIQFIRLTGFGRTPGRGCEPHETIEGITGEAVRAKGCAPHIRYPSEPRLVYGISPTEVGREAIRLSLQARDSIGRRLKSDAVALVAGVVTFPIPVAEMGGFESDGDAYNLWVTKTLDWLLKEFSGLVSVVEHTDEGYLHLHFFCLPQLAPDGQLDFLPAHPGRKALKEAKERGVEPAVQQAAYTNAMIAWQDRYHQEVSKFFGHDRYGPRRRRVDRARHKANREAAAKLVQHRAELELEYRIDVSDEEADVRSQLIDEADVVAAAVATIRQQRREIVRLRSIMRDRGIVDDNVTVGALDDDLAYSASASETRAMNYEIEMMPMPAPKVIQQPDIEIWPRQRHNIQAAADEVLRRLPGRDIPEPPSEPSPDSA